VKGNDQVLIVFGNAGCRLGLGSLADGHRPNFIGSADSIAQPASFGGTAPGI